MVARKDCSHGVGRTRKIGGGRLACPICRNEMEARLRHDRREKLPPLELVHLTRASEPRRFSWEDGQ